MIAAGASRQPLVGSAVSTGLQIISVKFVEAGLPELKFQGRGGRAQFTRAEPSEDVADERRRESMNDLLFTREKKKEKAFFA